MRRDTIGWKTLPNIPDALNRIVLTSHIYMLACFKEFLLDHLHLLISVSLLSWLVIIDRHFPCSSFRLFRKLVWEEVGREKWNLDWIVRNVENILMLGRDWEKLQFQCRGMGMNMLKDHETKEEMEYSPFPGLWRATILIRYFLTTVCLISNLPWGNQGTHKLGIIWRLK